jgi:hypothetical protein
MTYAPHQQRVVDEKTDLDDKLSKLITFFDNPFFGTLDPAEQFRMKQQAEAMKTYSTILGERIGNF